MGLTERRVAEHNAGQGAKYTRGRGPVVLVYREAVKDRPAALRLREVCPEKLVLLHDPSDEEDEFEEDDDFEDEEDLDEEDDFEDDEGEDIDDDEYDEEDDDDMDDMEDDDSEDESDDDSM